jgi:N-sulfoglucosamine sulfohydrolase
MKKLSLFILLFISLLGCFGAEQPMNVLLITADDMNGDSPGWMGNKISDTPNLNAYALTCHRFVNNHVTAPICQPSRSAIMTGRVPHRNGALGFNPINRDVPTLVEVLQRHGYIAIASNKTEHMKPDDKFPWDVIYKGSGKKPQKLGEEAAEAIAKAKAVGKPFFIDMNSVDPHRPFYGSADEDKKRGKNGIKESKNEENVDAGSGSVVTPYTPLQVMVPSFLEDIPGVRKEVAQFYTNVRRFDVSFGNIMKALKASGQEDHTLVVFLSDHGMSFPFSKATVYYNGTSSPVIMRWPGMKDAQVHYEMTSSVDIMPTILDIIGVDKPNGMDGRSWLPLMNGETQSDRDYVVTHVNGVSSGDFFPQRCIRTLTSSLIFDPWVDGKKKFKVEAMSGLSYEALAEAGKTDARIQARVDQYIKGRLLAFYDLKKDPEERTNVIEDPTYKAEVERLEQLLLTHMEKTNDPQLESFKAVLKKK